ncbi:MAG: quinol:cytochrome C oxidoreductase [Bacteroidota bacterium]|nr:quinol:cytochrome C oxidoreductase [Bacteroidota bacterium]MDX5428534.1 quinol:cytochrome C oxidoreductase [Bacteroidota bacterium]MDX5448311.1 quinol:cytochrome C oxidoreductase [Bacteroidota bacterium]MDX5506292.1 quinol:cytochrome C oxidoreductase [Bacteroidota bacterium]
MKFEFTSKARTLAIVLFVVGLIGVIAGFATNGAGHHEAAGHEEHATEMTNGDDHGTHEASAHNEGHAEEHGHDAELAHHQQANRPWSALYVNSFFFFCIGLGSMFFLGVQYVARAGWSTGLLRIFEAVAFSMVIPGIVLVVIQVLGMAHIHHMFHWMADGVMDPSSDHYDEIIAGKQGYLNPLFFTLRAAIYLIGWILAAVMIRKNSLKEDEQGGVEFYKKNVRIAAIFTVFFAVTSSTAAWDWIMSIDTHWFSTLFGWYTFAGMFVTALTVLNMLTVYLKEKGYLEWINVNHLHDLGKFMFAFSIFWTYLWFSQFMLIWYSNIPEEVTYYMQRFGEYKLLFFTMVTLNFVFPVLLLMPRDAKRNYALVMFTGIFVLIGHWLDHYIMVMPGTVGPYYGFGLVEISGFIMYTGLFIFVVFRSLAKAPLMQKNHPMILESKYFHQ